MSTPLPFVVSPEAEQWLLRLPLSGDQQPGFFCSPRFGVYKGGELVEEFSGEHYSFTYASAETWLSVRSAVSVQIGGRPFWLTTDILDKLRGKSLTVIQKDVGRGLYAGKIREFLVAD